MSLYAIPPLLGTLAFATLGLFIFFHPPHTKEKKLFSVLCLETFIWQVIWFISFFSPSLKFTDFLAKFAYLGITFIPFSFYHFIVEFLKAKEEKRYLFSFYTLGTFLVLLIFPTNLFVSGHRHFSWGNFAAAGPLYPIFMILALAAMIRGCYILIKAKSHPTQYPAVRRSQIHYLLLGLGSYFFCTLDFPQVFGFPLYPVGTLFFLFSFSIISYAITFHRLMDIEVIIKRTLVFAGLSFFVLAAFAVPFYVATNLFGFSATGQARWWLLALIGIAITAVFRPLDRFLINVTDKYLFQKKFDFAQVLKDASQDIAWVTNLEDLTRKMLYVLIHKARTKHAAIYVRPTEHDRFELHGWDGEEKEPAKFFPKESPLISYLGERQVPITRALIDESLGQVRNGPKRTQFKEIYNVMTELGAEVIVPSFLSGSTEMGIESHPFLRLQGFLVLGGKKSDEDYTQQDLNVLAAIAQEHAVSFEKIRIFDEYLKERELKLKAEKTAESVNYTRTLKHETGNKLVGIESAAINLRKEFSEWFIGLKKQIEARLSDTELKMCDQLQSLVKKYAGEIEQNGAKVRMTIDSVVGGLSGDQAPKQAMDFRVPWETAKRNVKVDHDFRFDVKTEDFFKIYGIVNSIEQVFENFFTNSRDAMANKEEKLIHLRGSYRDLQGHKVTWFEYWDEGTGVPEELFEKVFEQDFSTKPKPKTPTSMESGHGHGLYVCRKIVEGHGGKIWLEKRTEGGSKFIFWLPLQEEVQNKTSQKLPLTDIDKSVKGSLM